MSAIEPMEIARTAKYQNKPESIRVANHTARDLAQGVMRRFFALLDTRDKYNHLYRTSTVSILKIKIEWKLRSIVGASPWLLNLVEVDWLCVTDTSVAEQTGWC